MSSAYASESTLYEPQLQRKEHDTILVNVGGKIDHKQYLEPYIPYFRYTCKIQAIMPERVSKTCVYHF